MPTAANLLADLTDEQREAVTHGEGPLLILAGAGSGKTRVITRRVAYLLGQGVPPWNILAITFTNKAAGEMRARVEQLVPGHRVLICTFHSLGARLLRQYADRLGLDRNFTIYDTEDRNKLVKEALEACGFDNVKFGPERVGAAISRAKNALITPQDYERTATDFFQQVVAKAYYGYEKRLRATNALDFDDLLYLPALALKHHEDLRAELDARFRYVLIDEYQDTNTAQYALVRRLSLNHPNLCVVGDPDQSIYKWRGSDIKNILDFERDFPDARVITLVKNYRSTQAILHAADTLIAHNRQRKPKTLTTDNERGEPVRVLTFETGAEEAEGIARRIREAVRSGRYCYRDHAVFLRVNALSRMLEAAFVRHGVPFQIVKGLAFFERKENKDVLAYLRLLVNPADALSFLRAVNEPPRGIGAASLEKLQAYAAEHGLSLLEAAGQVGRITAIKGKAAAALRDFYRLVADLRARLDRPPHELVQLVLEKSGYEAMLRDSGDEEDAERLANVGELVTAARQFHDANPAGTLADFLEQITLASDVDAWNDQADHVSVMTLHASKGLEFPVVYIPAVEQGLLPHERSLARDEDVEEERRLCYVGMTRAKKELYLSHARLREFRGVLHCAIESNFLRELPRDEVEWVDAAEGRPGFRTAADEWRTRTVIAPTPAPDRTDPLDAGLAIGAWVRHPDYGLGRVTDLAGYGALRRVKVRFPAGGEKTFFANKADLKVVGRNRAAAGGDQTEAATGP